MLRNEVKGSPAIESCEVGGNLGGGGTLRRGGAGAISFLAPLSGGGLGGAFFLSAYDESAEIGIMERGSDFSPIPVIRFGSFDEAS